MTAVSGTEPRPRERLPDREAEALAEVAATVGGATWRWALVGAFLLSIVAGPVLEVSPSWRARTASWPRSHVAWPRAEVLRTALDRGGLPALNLVLRGSIQSINRYIERDAVACRLLRPPVQSRLRDRLGYGNGQVIAGSETWLFYQHEFAAAVGAPFLAPETLARRARPGWRLYPAPRPDPVAGLTRFAAQLERHGARLVLMIAPSKVAVSPEKLAGSAWAAPRATPLSSSSFADSRRRGFPSTTRFRSCSRRPGTATISSSTWTRTGLRRGWRSAPSGWPGGSIERTSSSRAHRRASSAARRAYPSGSSSSACSASPDRTRRRRRR